MNPEFNRLQHKHQEQENLQQEVSRSSVRQSETEFETVEDLIRADAAQVETPPEIGIRLNESIASEPKPPRPWFKKFFS
jgi:hypothetical protein